MKRDNRKPQQGKNTIKGNKLIIPEKRNSSILFIIVAFCFPVLLYLQTIHFGFTYFDDDGIIINNIAFISDFSNAHKAFLTDAFMDNSSAFYRPLQTLSYMIDVKLSGVNNTWMYHLSNILLLGAISCSLFLLLKRFLIPSDLALLGALIFCANPLFVSSIAWIPARGDLQLLLLSLLSFLFFIEFLQKRKIIYLFLNWIAFTIALYCKETATFLPFLFIIYFFTFRHEKPVKKKYLFIIVLYAVSGILWFWLRNKAIGDYSNPNEMFGLTAILQNLRVIPEALLMFFLPFDFAPIPDFSILKTLAGLSIIALIIIIFFKNKERSGKEKFFCFSWFLILMFPPMLYKVPFVDYLNHRFFLPLVGILLFVLFMFPAKWLKKGAIKRYWLMVAVILFLSSLSFIKSRSYSDPVVFYNSAISHNPNSPIVYFNRGYVKYTRNDFKGAIEDYDKVIEINPGFLKAYYSRGVAKADMGDTIGAINDYNIVISKRPKYYKAYFGRGNVKNTMGDFKGAIIDFNKAIALHPDYIEAYNNRGLAKANMGDKTGAIEDYNKTIAICPTYYMAYYNRGCVKNTEADFKGAIMDFDKTIALDPACAEAYNNKGFSNYSIHNFNEAINNYSRAIEINPDYLNAYFNRAIARYYLKDLKGTIEDCENVLKLNPDYQSALQLKAKALQEIKLLGY